MCRGRDSHGLVGESGAGVVEELVDGVGCHLAVEVLEGAGAGLQPGEDLRLDAGKLHRLGQLLHALQLALGPPQQPLLVLPLFQRQQRLLLLALLRLLPRYLSLPLDDVRQLLLVSYATR